MDPRTALGTVDRDKTVMGPGDLNTTAMVPKDYDGSLGL